MFDEVKIRTRLIELIALIGASAFFVFGIENFVRGNIFLGLSEIILTGLALANIAFLIQTKKTAIASWIILALMLVALQILLITGGLSQTGYLWFFTFPPLAFFLLETKSRGFQLTAFFIVWLSIAYFLQVSEIISTAFPSIILRQLIPSLVAVSTIIYVFSAQNESRLKAIKDKSSALESLEEKLKEKESGVQSIESSVADDRKELENTRIAMINLVEDLSEEKEKFEQQAQELKKFQMAVEGASDQIVITDTNGIVLYANPTTEKLTGYPIDKIIGRKAGELWGGQMDTSFYRKMWDKIKKQKKVYEGIIINKRADGTLYDTLTKISPLLDESGEIQFFVSIERDVSKEKELERLKDEFVSVASHELRTPLTAIQGLVSMTLEGDYGPVTDELKEPLTDVKTSSQRLIHLVNDMLSVSRIEAGRLKYDLEKFDVKPLVETTAKLLNVVAKQKGIKILAKNIQSAEVQADKDKVEQVLNNLIGNSIKFTDKGSITITTKKTKDLLEVAITDTGIGISKKDQDKLFNKFQQIEANKNRPPGTGLGLFISKKICQKMGGDLNLVSSVKGKGSTFSFSIPLAGSKQAKKTAQTIRQGSAKNLDQKSDLIQT